MSELPATVSRTLNGNTKWRLMDWARCVPLRSGDVGGALGLVLEQAPYGEEVDEAKVGHFPSRSLFPKGA